MIKLTRLNGSELWVNADLIEFLEATPDTVISLVDGKKIVVADPPERVVAAIIAYWRQINAVPRRFTYTDKGHGDPSASGPGKPAPQEG